MNHIIFYSSGKGSWATAKRVVEQHGSENLILLFADTMIEDEDNYRFLHESAFRFTGNKQKLVIVADGRTPFDLWKDHRTIANNQIPFCSQELKMEVCRNWLCDNEPNHIASWHRRYRNELTKGVFVHPDRKVRRQIRSSLLDQGIPEKLAQKQANQRAKACPWPKPLTETILYIGIGWDEIHRLQAVIDGWQPWLVKAPMTEAPYLDSNQILSMMADEGLKPPRLYRYGLAHANCGGGCVRSGQAHWKHVYNALPNIFSLWESEENKMRAFLGKNVSMMKRTINGSVEPFSLSQLRKEIEADGQLDLFDWGGCGCFVEDVD